MIPDKKRRASVMSRSVKLGHCVCNTLQPCPCDTFRAHNVCQCAGERMPVKQGDVALTKHVRRAGCASKIGQADLFAVLRNLPPVEDPNVLVGIAAGDDAGVYRLDDKTALVQTVDVFTPCVDDPYLFGQIAAANSVSDVYAMGGKPLTALSVIGFPIEELDGSIMERMLRGAMDKLREASCSLVGGHSINDEEIKLGFAVTGIMAPKAAVRRDSAEVGDLLVLTKPIGTGMVSFGAQIGRVSRACLEEVGAWMATLNRDAGELMVKHGAHAGTDITGYGLAGHLVEMVRGSGVSAELDLSRLPVFGVVPACLENDILSGAIERNASYAMGWVHSSDPDAKSLNVLYDPQTSGGLLVALPSARAKRYVAEMHARGHKATSVIGRIVSRRGSKEGRIIVMKTNLANLVGSREGVSTAPRETAVVKTVSAPAPAASECCAAAGPSQIDSTAAAGGSLDTFTAFMAEANRPGAVDARTKKLIAIALSISNRCMPCFKVHVEKALAMGIGRTEIDEAAKLATAFGGCTVMMFYRDACREIAFESR